MSTYIKLEDLENFFWNKALKSRGDETVKYINLKDEINSLPSISFEEMIKEAQDKYGIGNKKIDVLEELLNKLPK